MTKAKRLKSFTGGAPSSTGTLVRFEIETTEGEKLLFEMPSKNIGHVVTALIDLALRAANKAGPVLPRAMLEGALIEARTIRAGRGRTGNEIILGIDCGPFDLGVAVPISALGAIKELVEQTQSNQPPPTRTN